MPVKPSIDMPIQQIREQYPETYQLWMSTPGLTLSEAHDRTGETFTLVADAHAAAERIASSKALDERTKAIRVNHLDLTLAEAQNVARRQLVEEGVAVPAMTVDQFAALKPVEQAAVSRAIDAGELPPLDVPEEVLTPSQKAIRGMELTPEEQVEVFGPILAAQNDRHTEAKVARERKPFEDVRGADIKAYMERGHTEAEAEAKFPWSEYVTPAKPKSESQLLQEHMRSLDPAVMGLAASDES